MENDYESNGNEKRAEIYKDCVESVRSYDELDARC